MRIGEMDSNRFVFVACHYNMSASIARMLHSICAQSYTDWRLIITDDVSSIRAQRDGSWIVSRFQELLNDGSAESMGKIVWKQNVQKKWETLNVLTMIREHCDDDDIVCRIDADDALIDSHALYAIDQVYRESDCDALWTNHRWVSPEGEVSGMNISGPITERLPVHKCKWTMSHMKTFRKRLLNDVNEENFKDADGNYFRRAGDRAVYLPALHRARKKVHLPMVTYAYTCSLKPETFQTEDAKFQKAEADFIAARGFVE